MQETVRLRFSNREEIISNSPGPVRGRTSAQPPDPWGWASWLTCHLLHCSWLSYDLLDKWDGLKVVKIHGGLLYALYPWLLKSNYSSLPLCLKNNPETTQHCKSNISHQRSTSKWTHHELSTCGCRKHANIAPPLIGSLTDVIGQSNRNNTLLKIQYGTKLTSMICKNFNSPVTPT